MASPAEDETTTASAAQSSNRLQSQTQRAVAELRDMIVNNRLPPGSNHLETELAETLGMSRTPVREAMLLLAAQGLVEVRPRRGMRVLSLSAHDMAEVYDILIELEGLAAERAAERDLSPDDLGALEHALTEMESALEADDRVRWAEHDQQFHDMLVSLSGNRRLVELVNSFNDQVRRARLLTLQLRPSPTKSNRDHRALFDAIKAGDAAYARAIHTAHRTAAKKLIIDLLETHSLHQI